MVQENNWDRIKLKMENIKVFQVVDDFPVRQRAGTETLTYNRI